MPHERELERRLLAVDRENQALEVKFQAVQRELQDIKTQETETLAGIQQRITEIEAVRDEARQQVDALTLELAETSGRLETAESRVNLLDSHLEDEGRKHQLEMQHVQARSGRQERRLKRVTLLALFAFLLASLATVSGVLGVIKNADLLSNVGRDIRDIKASLIRQAGRVQEPAGDHAPAPAREAPGALVAGEEPAAAATSGPAIAEQPAEIPQAGNKTKHVTAGHAAPDGPQSPVAVPTTREDTQAFFERNALQPGVVTLPSGLQYKVLRDGSGRSPTAADKVVIDYRGFLPDGTEFGSSYQDAEPATFLVDELNPGMKEALLRMKVGAQWELYIPPSLAHAGGVRKRGITGFRPQFYVVELISIIPASNTAIP